MAENFKRPFWVVHRPSQSPDPECLSGEAQGKTFVILFASKDAADKARGPGNGMGSLKELPSAVELSLFLRSIRTVGIEYVAIDHGGDDVQLFPLAVVLKAIDS